MCRHPGGSGFGLPRLIPDSGRKDGKREMLSPADNSPAVDRAFVEQARRLLSSDYCRKIERCLGELDDRQLWWRPNEESNSVGNLLLHLSGNVRQWLVCGLGGAADQRQRQTEFDQREPLTREYLLRELRKAVADADAVLAEFDLPRLTTAYRIQECDVTALEAIFHVVEHFSMHTGQIILLTKLITASDLHFYDFQGDTPLQQWGVAKKGNESN